jgi:hypothetical protein
MWLLSQGSWVKVVAPDFFVEEIVAVLKKMTIMYNDIE